MRAFSSLVFQALAALLFTSAAYGHTIFTTLYINGDSQGDGTCVRMNKNAESCTSPIPGLYSDDMACGITGEQPVAFTCPAPAGATLTFEFRLWANAAHPGVIDISHKGPCSVYAKRLPSGSSSIPATGPGWFKIWDSGYDEGTGKWCTETLRDNKGLLSVELPTGLPAGDYLFRPELLALHNARDGDPQFYTGCAQVFVESSVSGALSIPDDHSVSIPGHVDASDPGVDYNIYANPLSLPYIVPGPKPWSPPAPSSSSSSSSSKYPTNGDDMVIRQPATIHSVPQTYILKNANWVGFEVSDYSTENGCWSSADECWDQTDACYDTAPPTGNKNCHAWEEEKCSRLNDLCAAGEWQGPPNKGRMMESRDAPRPGSIPPPANRRAVVVASDDDDDDDDVKGAIEGNVDVGGGDGGNCKGGR